jgi:hypothetical protein
MENKKLFHEIKEKILKNLFILQSTFSRCQDSGLADEKSVLYNKIYELIDKVKNSQQFGDLSVLVMEARDLEQNLEFWISSNGGLSMELAWPIIPE